DVERDVLGHRQVVLRLRELDAKLFAVTDLVAGLAWFAVHEHMAAVDRVLDDTAAEVGELQREVPVEAHAFGPDFDVDVDRPPTRNPRRGRRGLVVFQFVGGGHYFAFGSADFGG